MTDETEKREALFALVRKYLPEHMDKAEEYIARSWNSTALYAISMDRITGKAKRKKI